MQVVTLWMVASEKRKKIPEKRRVLEETRRRNSKSVVIPREPPFNVPSFRSRFRLSHREAEEITPVCLSV